MPVGVSLVHEFCNTLYINQNTISVKIQNGGKISEETCLHPSVIKLFENVKIAVVVEFYTSTWRTLLTKSVKHGN